MQARGVALFAVRGIDAYSAGSVQLSKSERYQGVRRREKASLRDEDE